MERLAKMALLCCGILGATCIVNSVTSVLLKKNIQRVEAEVAELKKCECKVK